MGTALFSFEQNFVKIRSESARFLVYIFPAGFEEYFHTLGEAAEYLAPQENPAPTSVQRSLTVSG